MNAAISAAWKALPEDLRTQYKQRAQALKLGGAQAPEATTSGAGVPGSHAQNQAHAPATAVPAAVNIAAHLTDVGPGAEVANHAAAGGGDAGAAASNFGSQSGGKQGPVASVVPGEPHTLFDGVDAPTYANAPHPVDDSAAAEAGDVGPSAVAGDVQQELGMGLDDGQHAAEAMNDVEGGE